MGKLREFRAVAEDAIIVCSTAKFAKTFIWRLKMEKKWGFCGLFYEKQQF
jgi:hypothetical protein